MGLVASTADSARQDPRLILQTTSVVAGVVEGPCDSGTLDGAANVLTAMVSGAGSVGLDPGVATAALRGIGSILGQAGEMGWGYQLLTYGRVTPMSHPV